MLKAATLTAATLTCQTSKVEATMSTTTDFATEAQALLPQAKITYDGAHNDVASVQRGLA